MYKRQILHSLGKRSRPTQRFDERKSEAIDDVVHILSTLVLERAPANLPALDFFTAIVLEGLGKNMRLPHSKHVLQALHLELCLLYTSRCV